MLIGLTIAGILVAGIFCVKYEIEIRNRLNLLTNRVNTMGDFLIKNFPEEVEKYNSDKLQNSSPKK